MDGDRGQRDKEARERDSPHSQYNLRDQGLAARPDSLLRPQNNASALIFMGLEAAIKMYSKKKDK